MLRKITWIAKKPIFNAAGQFEGWEKVECRTRKEAREKAGQFNLSEVRIKRREAKNV